MRRLTLPVAILGIFTSTAWAIDGDSLALRSGGTDLGTAWQLDENGYLGTYITLAAPGMVNFTINASASNAPQMNLVVGDERMEWAGVGAGNTDYMAMLSLPAGTHFVRTEMPDDYFGDKSLTINSLDVTGATINNANTDANALAASDTYVAHGRRGNATVDLSDLGVTPGMDVEVRLVNHAFNFGTSIHGFNDNGIMDPNPTPGSDAYNFQEFIKEHFNMIVPTNAGKWSQNEPTEGSPNMNWYNKQLTFAEANGLRVRQHAMLWGDQQPIWFESLVVDAVDGVPGAVDDLQDAITDRIGYYVGSDPAPAGTFVGADRYVHLDVYNESVHTGVQRFYSVWNALGPEGVSDIFEDVAAVAGPDVKLFVNEFNILQNGFDNYGNWYREHIEEIQAADGDPSDGPVSGVGMQYYALTGHSTAYMQQVLQNLSIPDLAMMLTEFGVQNNPSMSQGERIKIVTESLRMIFGTPNMEGFMYWSWPQFATGNLQRNSILVNNNWQLTPVGVVWSALMNSWTTDLTATVNPDGTINFTGFFGDYEIVVDGDVYDMTLVKGETFYELEGGGGGGIVLGFGVSPWDCDFDLDGDVDADDLAFVKGNFGATGSGFLAGDVDGDGDVDIDDLVGVKNHFGFVAPAAPLLTFVPEPASMALLGLGTLLLSRRR